MVFSKTLIEGRLIRRYKRFLVDVDTSQGVVTAHCPNTGSMAGCLTPGCAVWLSPAENPERKLAWTWEIVEPEPGVRVGLHTGRANGLVEEAIQAGLLPALGEFAEIRREVKYGRENSRIDLLLRSAAGALTYVEVKNVTAAVADGVGYFPDAVTERGSKHLRELMAMVAEGHRAAVVFCVQRNDVVLVQPADHIDPVYGATLRQAMAAGVMALALGAEVTPAGISLIRPLPVRV